MGLTCNLYFEVPLPRLGRPELGKQQGNEQRWPCIFLNVLLGPEGGQGLFSSLPWLRQSQGHMQLKLVSKCLCTLSRPGGKQNMLLASCFPGPKDWHVVTTFSLQNPRNLFTVKVPPAGNNQLQLNRSCSSAYLITAFYTESSFYPPPPANSIKNVLSQLLFLPSHV